MSEQTEQGKKPEAAPPKLYERGTWLHERDGDLNPTWVFVAIYLGVGLIVCFAAIALKSPAAVIAALSFLGTVIVALLISALPLAKSKVLARAHLGEVAGGIAGAAGTSRDFGVRTEDLDGPDLDE